MSSRNILPKPKGEPEKFPQISLSQFVSFLLISLGTKAACQRSWVEWIIAAKDLRYGKYKNLGLGKWLFSKAN